MSAPQKRHEVELDVMRSVYVELRRLTAVERDRVLHWVLAAVDDKPEVTMTSDRPPGLLAELIDNPFK